MNTPTDPPRLFYPARAIAAPDILQKARGAVATSKEDLPEGSAARLLVGVWVVFFRV